MPFQTKYFCDACNDIFYKMTEHDPRKSKGRKPSCPNCKKSKKVAEKGRMKLSGQVSIQTDAEIKQSNDAKMQEIIVSQKAPASGAGAFTQAMDTTARIVMEDFGMTNLRDNLRVGDNMVMPLQGKDVSGVPLESRVDSVFTPQKNNVMGMAGRNINNVLTSAINAGQYNGYGDVVAKQQQSGIRPKVNYINEYHERPANANTRKS